MAARDLVFTILGIDKGSPAFDKVAKSADAAEKRLSSFGKVGTKALASFPVAALAAGVGAAGGLALIGTAVAATAAGILNNNEQIATSAKALWADLGTEAQVAAAPLAGAFTEALDEAHQAVIDLAPQMRELFGAAAPAIDHLSDGVVKFARNAMPGLVTAMKSSQPVFEGFESLLEDTGTGVTRFFTNLSTGAESSGRIVASTGRIVRDFSGFAGSLFAQLANSGAPSVAVLEGFLAKLEGTVLSLGQGAFPILATGASGFLAAGSGILTILNALSPVLGPLIGHLGTFALTLKAIDAITFGGVTGSWAVLKKGIGDADGFAGKAKAGLSGLVSSGLGPLAIAAGIGALALEALGASQQRTAQRQQAITAAFRESKGAIDENVRATKAKSLEDEGLLQKAKDIGVSAGIMTDAFLGNKAAIDEVRAAAARYTKELEGQGQLEGQVAQGADALATKAHEVVSAMDDQSSETANAAREGKLYAEAMNTGAKGAEGLAKANKAATEEVQKLHEEITALVNKDIGYRNAIEATKEAQKAATEALKEHGAKSTEAAEAGRNLESAYATQAQAAYELSKANSRAKDDLGKNQEAAQAYTSEVLNMAMAAGDNAPRALQLMAGKLSEADLAAVGATREVNELRETVITLPDGKKIVLNAEDNASAKIRQIANGNYTAVVKLYGQWAGFSSTPNGVYLNNSSARGNAAGGWIHGPGTETSDSIPRMLSNKEFVVRASQAKKHAAVLEAINAGRSIDGAMQSAPASSPGLIQPQKVVLEFKGDFWEGIKRYVKVTAGGNVQKAFGQ